MAVPTHHIALTDFDSHLYEGSSALTVTADLKVFQCRFTVVEVHDVVGVPDPTVHTRLGLLSAYELVNIVESLTANPDPCRLRRHRTIPSCPPAISCPVPYDHHPTG